MLPPADFESAASAISPPRLKCMVLYPTTEGASQSNGKNGSCGVGEFDVCQDRDMGVDFSELEVAFVANFVEPNKVLIVIKS